jgi:hypothetical protein
MATLTENGAISYPVDDPLLNLFYHALRDTPVEKMQEMVSNAWSGMVDESPAIEKKRHLHVLKILFHLRWCRGGKGERMMFRIGLNELIEGGQKQHVLVNLQNIVHYGYWKDLLYFFDTEIEQDIIELYSNQLETDLINLCDKKMHLITLAAKWAPSEKKEIDKKYNAVHKFCKHLCIDRGCYRKNYLVPLRQQLDLVETKLCNKEWDGIDYAKLPSLARLKYAKSFQTHDPKRYAQYLVDVANGKTKMNVKLIYPHQLVAKYLDNVNSENYPNDLTLDTMWNELVVQTRIDLKKAGANLHALGVADCSGSMCGIPMQNSVALCLLWAELCEGRFHGHFYTFSKLPKLIRITAKTLKDKVKQVMKYSVVENTDLQALFDDLLAHAQLWNLSKTIYPKKIYIFTDGQFDSMIENGGKTNLEMIEEKHRISGYPLPDVVFWNLRGDTIDFPSPGDRKGIAMLSGFSPSLMKLIIEGKELDPSAIMLQAIEDPLLDQIKLAN